MSEVWSDIFIYAFGRPPLTVVEKRTDGMTDSETANEKPSRRLTDVQLFTQECARCWLSFVCLTPFFLHPLSGTVPPNVTTDIGANSETHRAERETETLSARRLCGMDFHFVWAKWGMVLPGF